MAIRDDFEVVAGQVRLALQRFALAILVLLAFAAMLIGKADTVLVENARVLALDLASPALEAIARAGGGIALPAREAGTMMQRIESARTARLATSDDARRVFRDLGPFLIPFAMVALLPLFRRRG